MSSNYTYLDYAASTPLEPQVLEEMLPYFGAEYGNPSSAHQRGQRVEAAVEDARRSMAAILGCAPAEIIFTACGSESDNLALRGAALAARKTRQATRIITTAVEHHAVLHTAEDLAANYGFELVLLPVDQYGAVDPQDLAGIIDQRTAVVSIMHANNEVGTINPIAELSAITRQHGIAFHSDAVQSASQLEVDVETLGVDLLSLGAHKFYGPKGVGALYVRAGTPMQSILTGGSQEYGLRAGTHNVPLIVGMAAALRLTTEALKEHNAHYQALRDRMIGAMCELDGVALSGHPQQRLPNHASFIIEGVESNQLLQALDLAGFACSAGSACKTGDPRPSAVLLAMGYPRHLALSSLRVTVGRQTQPAEIDAFVALLAERIPRLRSLRAAQSS